MTHVSRDTVFFQQFANLAKNQGMKRALSISKDYPALLLMPAFSIWAFGSSKKKSCLDCKGSVEISVSFTSTLINTIITTFGMASTWFYSNTKTQKWDKLEPIILTFGPLLISVILVVIVACMDKCCVPCTTTVL